jgi:hypothetical protein
MGIWQIPASAIAALCMTLIAMAVAMAVADREPRYSGRTLREWVKRYEDAEARSDAREKVESRAAVLNLLSNDVPRVVSYLTHDPGEHVQRVNARVQIVPRFMMRPAWRLMGWFAPDRYSGLADAAMGAFRIAGPQAGFAVPELNRVMLGTNYYGCCVASISLAYTGEAARGPLEAVITNRAHPFRFFAVRAVAGLPGGRTAASNALSMALQDPDPQVREVATNVLVVTNLHQWMANRTKGWSR